MIFLPTFALELKVSSETVAMQATNPIKQGV